MKVAFFARLLAVLGFSCALGMAPVMAQVAGTGTMAPVAPPSAAPSATAPAAKSTVKLSAAVEFKTVALAQAHCPGDVVVWSSLSKSHSFHLSGSKFYGTTKRGAYVCKGDALAAGFHQARS